MKVEFERCSLETRTASLWAVGGVHLNVGPNRNIEQFVVRKTPKFSEAKSEMES